ncbi:MAG TPA: hypothetical protein VFZ16_12775 [Hyphomicrobiaceae bacterium]|nr:hypothetical protein [Hyphomicrobiaceae bacterium]
MARTEQLVAVAERLTDEQIEALLDFAQSMTHEPFYERAPAEASESLGRGLAELDRGEAVPFEELADRLSTAAKPHGI